MMVSFFPYTHLCWKFLSGLTWRLKATVVTIYNLVLIGCSWCICSNQQSIRGMIGTPGHSPHALLKECMGQKTSLMSEKVF